MNKDVLAKYYSWQDYCDATFKNLADVYPRSKYLTEYFYNEKTDETECWICNLYREKVAFVSKWTDHSTEVVNEL